MDCLSWQTSARPVMFASGNRMTDTEDRPCPEDIRSLKVLATEVGSETLTLLSTSRNSSSLPFQTC